MKIDKEGLLEKRGYLCECGCGQQGHDLHHALIHRMKRFPELDCEENLIVVNHLEHIVRKFDNKKWRAIFWQKQVNRYGLEHMLEWVEGLPDKLRNRIDFVNW